MKCLAHKFHVTAARIVFFALCAVAVRAQDLSQYQGQDPKALFDKSWDSASSAEKVAIRTYLVRNFADTEYGCISKAWLSGYEGDSHERELYQVCATRYPNSLQALWNLKNASPTKEKLAILERILLLDPSFQNYGAIRDTYFGYLDDLKDPASAHSFLAKWEQRLPGTYIFDFIRGLEAQYDEKDWPKARGFYEKTMLANPRLLEVRMKMADGEIARMAQEGKDINAQAEGLTALDDFVKQLAAGDRLGEDRTLLYNALIDLGDLCRDRLNSRTTAAEFYLQAFRVLPTVEAEEAAAGVTYTYEEEKNLLEAAVDQFPTSPQILILLGRTEPNTDLARKDYEKAITYSLTLKDEYSAAANLAGDLLEDRLFDYEAAAEIYRKYLPRLTDTNHALDLLYENRREAGSFAEARKYLDQDEAVLEKRNSVNKSWFRSRRLELDEFLEAEAASESFYKRNPFLRSWRQQFGESLNATIHFSSSSDAILASDSQTLARIAEALNQQGAEQYVFAVEGYAPETGADAGKHTASLRLAQAVVGQLNHVYGVPLSRLRATAGALSGPAEVRRVAILPVGNAAEPAIVATAALTSGGQLALDPLGRTMALGTDPLEIWDVKQEARLRSLGSCGYRAFSPNGHYLACALSFTDAGDYKRYAILVYDVATGLRVAQIALPDEAVYVAWNPASTQIVFVTDKPQIVVYDMQQKKRIRGAPVPPGQHIAAEGLVWTRDGRYIVSAIAQAKELLVWNPADLTVVRKLEGVNWPHSLGETADGQYLVCADNTFILSVWDEATFQLRQIRTGVLSGTMTVHPRKPIVLLDDFSHTNHQKLLMVDVANMKVLETRETGMAKAMAWFTPDGGRVLSAELSHLFVLDPDTLKQTGEITGTAEPAFGGLASTRNSYFLVLDEIGVHVWDVTTGRKVHIWRQAFDRIVSLDGEGRFLAVQGDSESKTTIITLLDTNTFESSAWATLPMTVDAVSVAKRQIAFAGTEFHLPDEGPDSGTVRIYDRTTRSESASFSVPLVTAALEYDRIYGSGFASISLTDTGEDVAVVSWWQDGFGHRATYSRLARVFTVSTGKLRGKVEVRAGINSVGFEGEGNRYLRVTSGGGSSIWRSSDLKWERDVDMASGEHRIVLDSKEELFWAVNYIRTPKGLKPMPSMNGAAVFGAQNLLVTLNARNEIVFYDLKTLERNLTVVNKKGGEWIAYAPSGEFTTSLHGAEKVYWSLGYEYVDFDAFRERFEKPKVIAEHLRVLATGGASSSLAPPTISPEVFALPYTLEVVSKNNFDTTAASYDLEVRVVKQSAELPDPEIVYSQQGRSVDTEKGVRPKSGSDQIVRRSFDLGEGMNVIQANIRFKGATIPGPVVIVKRDVPRVSQDASPVNSLWFFGVGVSRYAHEEKIQRLLFADLDVEAISALLKKQEGKLYAHVNEKLMLNAEATAHEVHIQMNEFLKKAADQDVVVIMLSAHGVNDNGDLWLVTHDADPDQPYTGLNLAEIHSLLAHRPPNQKAIVWIDICHAGAFGAGRETAKGRLSADDAIKELAQGTGLIVLASSTASEASLESAEYDGGHGAFSAALGEALSGRTRTEGAGEDGKLTVLQLHNYVASRVPAMTKGRQHPTVPEAHQFRDFPIALPFN